MKYLLIIFLILGSSFAIANDGKKLAQNNGCFACHSVKTKVLGPAFVDVSKKYNGQAEINLMLINKIRNGGSGNWGDVPMIPHPNLSDDELKTMVKWILTL